MKTLKLYLIRWLQQQCTHPGCAVRADILEGALQDSGVQWCEICGAHRFTWNGVIGAWREPRPDWYTPAQRRQYKRDAQLALDRENRSIGSYR